MNAPSSSSAKAVLLRSLFERLPRVLGINFAVALCTVTAFSGQESWITLTLWLTVMTSSLALRLKAWSDFQRLNDQPFLISRWTRRFALGAGMTGAAWGLAGVLFYDPQSPVAQVFLPFVLAGMSGGSLVAQTGCTPAFVAFVVSALTPYALRLVVEADLAHLSMAAALIIYTVGIGFLGRSVNAYLMASVQLAAENEELVAALQEKSAQLEQKSDQLEQKSLQLETTIQHLNQGVAVFEQGGQLITWNRRHQQLHGYPDELYRSGMPLTRFADFDRTRREVSDTIRPYPAAPSQQVASVRFEQAGAENRVLEVECSPMPDGGFVSTSTDITERKRIEAGILYLAQHDPLTDLPNRLLLQDRLAQAMVRCGRVGNLLAVMLLDLDRFKEINDQFGHGVGDDVLVEIAARLKAGLRQGDTVARIGGDEFALILPHLADQEAAMVVANKIIARLQKPLRLDARERQMRASLGIALFPPDGDSAEQLMQHADLAMYRAKAAGGGVLRFVPHMGQGRRMFEPNPEPLGQEVRDDGAPRTTSATG